MKVLLAAGIIVAGYYYFLTQTANLVLNQTQQIHNTYSYVADHADQIASGR